jgi:hypothetical protein
LSHYPRTTSRRRQPMLHQEVKQHLLMGHNRILTESLNQALQLEAAKAAAEPPTRLWVCEW